MLVCQFIFSALFFSAIHNVSTQLAELPVSTVFERPFPIVYARESLLRLRSMVTATPSLETDTPPEACLTRRKRGQKGGIRVRLRRRLTTLHYLQLFWGTLKVSETNLMS